MHQFCLSFLTHSCIQSHELGNFELTRIKSLSVRNPFVRDIYKIYIFQPQILIFQMSQYLWYWKHDISYCNVSYTAPKMPTYQIVPRCLISGLFFGWIVGGNFGLSQYYLKSAEFFFFKDLKFTEFQLIWFEIGWPIMRIKLS